MECNHKESASISYAVKDCDLRLPTTVQTSYLYNISNRIIKSGDNMLWEDQN